MKVSSVTMPEKPFQVLRNKNSCVIEFYDNVKSVPTVDGITGHEIPSWDFDKYVLNEAYRPNLSAEIEADFSEWLQKAKDNELNKDAEKVRAYRDNLLDEADTKYCNSEKWAAMTEGQRAEWVAYKQKLRDVPEQDGFPNIIDWPIMPKVTEEEFK